ncbi:MFS transporter [Pseudoduganella violacea]|uniref:MFS family permease n=1 Tax=Pseudoduganella violacea TaxID=1715466 RepID=A0A7W5FX07_9BURK|nr:MFS transporter [Pseudoduganella violacea]MBB3121793.1 MFS family permease [Pseudoduganella violacea]
MSSIPVPMPDAVARPGPLILTACLTAAIIPLSIAGPAVVVPAINQALGGSTAELAWIINAYILTYGSATLAAGSLADTYGRKRTWLTGMLLFALVTAAIPYMPSVRWIDLLRLIQGLAAAAAFAGAMAALTQEFDGHARTRVFSLIGTTFGAGAAFGPFLAGLLTDSLGWQWVFLLPALVAVLASLLIGRFARETRDPQATGLDWPGAISFTAGLALLTYGVILAPEKGWGHAAVLASLASAAALLCAFVCIELRRERPLLDLSLFANARFVGVQVLAVAPAYAYIVLLVILPARFIGVEGCSALQAGRMMIALSAPLLLVPFIAGQLARWISVGMLSGLGLVIAAMGLAWLGHSISSDTASRFLAMATIGMGIGLPWGVMDGLAVSVVPKERAGMAAGIFNAVRLAGDGIALAAVGAMLSARMLSGLIASAGNGTPGGALAAASNRLAMSDMGNALVHVPAVGKSVLLQVYEGAFRWQLLMLAAAAAVTALVIFLLLGRVKTQD